MPLPAIGRQRTGSRTSLPPGRAEYQHRRALPHHIALKWIFLPLTNMESVSTLQYVSSKGDGEGHAALRTDAQRNRERLLVAAEELFLARGADISLDEVAKRAKVGAATLYRRFPTREALLAAMCDERLVAIAEASRARDGSCDPLSALRAFIGEVVVATNRYRGMAAVLDTVLRHPADGCEATTREGSRLLDRARSDGLVRQGLSMGDVICVVTAISLATVADGDTARISQLVDLFFDGFATRPEYVGE